MTSRIAEYSQRSPDTEGLKEGKLREKKEAWMLSPETL
jgi:hypothetical protein